FSKIRRGGCDSIWALAPASQAGPARFIGSCASPRLEASESQAHGWSHEVARLAGNRKMLQLVLVAGSMAPVRTPQTIPNRCRRRQGRARYRILARNWILSAAQVRCRPAQETS